MANCCLGGKCEELVNFGYLKSLASNLVGESCSITVGNGTTSTTCCSGSLTGDMQSVRRGQIPTVIPYWSENSDPKNDVNGVVVDMVHPSADETGCCGSKNTNSNQVIKKSDLTLKYTEYKGKTGSYSDTINPCGGSVNLYVTRSYTRHTRTCNTSTGSYTDSTSSTISRTDTLNNNSYGLYPYANSSYNNFEFKTFGSNSVSYDTQLLASGNPSITMSPCKSENVPWSVYQSGPTISANFSCPPSVSVIPCDGGEFTFGGFTGTCEETIDIPAVSGLHRGYTGSSDITLYIEQNNAGGDRFIEIQGTIKDKNGNVIGTIDVTSTCYQESCDEPIIIDAQGGDCGLYWPELNLSKSPEKNGCSCGTFASSVE